MRIGRYMDISPERAHSTHTAAEATLPTDHPKQPEELSTNEVRGGETGHGVRYVLAISLSAALIALGLAWVYVI